MHATYGSEREDVWVEPVCKWCCETSDEERPCGNQECERLAVRATRTRRIVSYVEALSKAAKLRTLYVAEGIPGDHRVVSIDARIHELDLLISATVACQVRDDAEARRAASTLPAPATVRDVDAVLEEMLAEDLNAAGCDVEGLEDES